MNGRPVHIWLAALDLPAEQVSRLSDVLSPDERDRAGGFLFAEGRDHFIAGRAFLRMCLGQILARDPASLRFRYGVLGKPSLDIQRAEIGFNLSHAGTLAALAVVTRAEDIGVDVEYMRPMDDLDGVINAALPAQEATRIHGLPRSTRLPAFYSAWTRKEAVLKARGCGMSEDCRETSQSAVWMVSNFEVGDRYAGAVAYQGATRKVCLRGWNWPSIGGRRNSSHVGRLPAGPDCRARPTLGDESVRSPVDNALN